MEELAPKSSYAGWKPPYVIHDGHVTDLTAEGQNFQILSHPTVDRGCFVCGRSHGIAHTFVAADGRVMLDLCEETCCRVALAAWRSREPDQGPVTMQGAVAAIRAVTADYRQRAELDKRLRGWTKHPGYGFNDSFWHNWRDWYNRTPNLMPDRTVQYRPEDAKAAVAVFGTEQKARRPLGDMTLRAGDWMRPTAATVKARHGILYCNWPLQVTSVFTRTDGGVPTTYVRAGTESRYAWANGKTGCWRASDMERVIGTCTNCESECLSKGTKIAPATHCSNWESSKPPHEGWWKSPEEKKARYTELYGQKPKEEASDMPPPGSPDGFVGGVPVDHKTSGCMQPPTPPTPPTAPPPPSPPADKLPGPASEESPPPPPQPKVPGRCAKCNAEVHTAAPARNGLYYCEACVWPMTCLHNVQKYIEDRKANPPPPPPLPPKPVGDRPWGLMGDLHGPKV